MFLASKTNSVTALPSSRCSPDAVDIVFRVDRHVEIEDVAHRRNIETASGHVGSDEQRDLVVLELLQRRHARALVHVAMKGADRVAMALQRTEHRLDVPLAVAEHDGVLEVFRFVDQLAQRLALVEILAAGCDHLLGDRIRGRRGAGHLDPGRIVQEGIDQTLDLRRHGGREQERLMFLQEAGEDKIDVVDEPHVEHLVSLVEDDGAHVSQIEFRVPDEVDEPPRCRHQDMHAVVELGFLDADVEAAVHGERDDA